MNPRAGTPADPGRPGTAALLSIFLLSLIGVLDLLLATQQAIARTFLIIEFYSALMAVYFIINFSISRVGAMVERRMAYVRF